MHRCTKQFLKVCKHAYLSSICQRKATHLVLGTVGAVATAVLIDRSFMEGRSLVINSALCSSDLATEQTRLLEEIEMYVNAILGSKMGNIPGLPGLVQAIELCVHCERS
jgi:hypothetical protein